MTNPIRYPQRPVELAGAVDDYLYGCDPEDGCGVCAALAKQLEAAKRAKDWGKAYDAAAEVRNHPHPKKGM
ncbi:hypothetical protein ACIBL5_16425 [Streptomyces sp. NPDC050516]|uniref:hypothetical protein n=1 Tax=Streptomyces sp. NPDC050516 TaxID=3365621 RepID=UPI0037B5723F